MSRLSHDGELYRARRADHESTVLGMALEGVGRGKERQRMFTVSFAIAYGALDWRGLRCDLEFAEHRKDTQDDTLPRRVAKLLDVQRS